MTCGKTTCAGSRMSSTLGAEEFLCLYATRNSSSEYKKPTSPIGNCVWGSGAGEAEEAISEVTVPISSSYECRTMSAATLGIWKASSHEGRESVFCHSLDTELGLLISKSTNDSRDTYATLHLVAMIPSESPSNTMNIRFKIRKTILHMSIDRSQILSTGHAPWRATPSFLFRQMAYASWTIMSITRKGNMPFKSS